MDNNIYTEPKFVKENGGKFECPTCNIEINKQTSPQQCKYCGQLLDWRPKGTVFFRGQMLRVGEDVFFGREPAHPSDRFDVMSEAIEAFDLEFDTYYGDDLTIQVDGSAPVQVEQMWLYPVDQLACHRIDREVRNG